MVKPLYDVTISGASLSGASLGLLLAQRGYRVMLLEKETFPRDKVCGEGLFPQGVELLDRIGLLPAVRVAGAVPFHSLQILSGRAHAVMSLERGAGLLFTRRAADAAVAQAAGKAAGLTLRQGAPVETIDRKNDHITVGTGGPQSDRIRTRILVVAEGARSRTRRLLNIGARPVDARRYGLRAHLRGAWAAPGQVDIHLGSHGEAYVAAQHEQSSVTLLLHGKEEHGPGAYRPANGDLREFFRRQISGFPALRSRVDQIDFCTEPGATAPLAVAVDETACHRAILVGDAAGSMDPILGQGMTVALLDACNAAAVIDGALARNDCSQRALLEYSRRRHQYFAGPRRMAAALEWIARHPAAAGPLVSLLENRPSLRRIFLKLALA